MAEKKINQEAFKQNMIKVWKFVTKVKIIEVGENLFIFEFCFDQYLHHVWEGQPWLFLLASNMSEIL